MEQVPPPFPGLWAAKPFTAAVLLLPQDGASAIYLVIRMLFLAFFSLWLSLFSRLPCCSPAGRASSEGSQECRMGSSSIPPLPPAECCCVVPKVKIKAFACSGRWMCGGRVLESTRREQLSHSWVSPRSQGRGKAWHQPPYSSLTASFKAESFSTVFQIGFCWLGLFPGDPCWECR